ncbi:hypothetical protein RJ55_03396 [Drechmeria coniospora]|nr:hypothetical protein RJ55_03396 [Drechmeria coniospora]
MSASSVGAEEDEVPRSSGNELFARAPLEVRAMIWKEVLDCQREIQPRTQGPNTNVFILVEVESPYQAALNLMITMLPSLEKTCRLFWRDQKTLQTFYRTTLSDLSLACSIIRNPQGRHRPCNEKILREAYQELNLRIFGEGRADIANNPYFVSGRTRSQHRRVREPRDIEQGVLRGCGSWTVPSHWGVYPSLQSIRQLKGQETIEIELLVTLEVPGFQYQWVRLDLLMKPGDPDHYTQAFLSKICTLYSAWCRTTSSCIENVTVSPWVFVDVVKDLAWEDKIEEQRVLQRLGQLATGTSS